MDRRAWIQGALGSFAALRAGFVPAAQPAPATGWFAQQHMPIGLQLYSVDEDARRDLDGTLARVAQIGFRTVELAGYHGHPVATLRAAAARNGIKFTSIHVSATAQPGEPGLDQDLPRLAADLHELGVTDVALPMLPFPERLGRQRQGESLGSYVARVGKGLTRADWQRVAELLNDRGGRLRAQGLRFSYHNHNPEFAPLGDSNGLEILLAETSPDDVVFELDVGWAAAGGADPVALLQQYGRRFQLMHLKDILASTRTNYALQQDPAAVGDGSIDWQHLLPAAYAAGVRKYYVEQEPPFATDRYTAIERSLRYLRAFDVHAGSSGITA
ncbi:MAG TPA: sugar phosphate isomerase/epimerase [Steroidobacteraceae bacterium]|nr:sugar phosphate isomerase/epimerase [Steroidobacteraceae bacterium]